MSENPDAIPDSYTPSVLHRLDIVCDRFEAAWKTAAATGQRPRIAEYLGDTLEPQRSALVRELIVLDIHYRCQAGEQPQAEEYRAWLPSLNLDEWVKKRPEDQDQLPPRRVPNRLHDALHIVREDSAPDIPPTQASPALPEPGSPDLTTVDRSALLARYEIFEEIGRGGMGIIYRARHKLLDRQIAVKVCIPGAHLERFRREAQLLASIRSPYIVTVHDFDLLPAGRALLIMDWIEGQDLGKLLQENKGPLPEAMVLPWMQQVCEGMRTAAAQGIVHRDLKPSNILIDQHNRQALVADFGLARSAQAEQLTWTGGLLGTPLYMAPEQAEDPRSVDTRADIYGFGATFYHVLTGSPPFQSNSYFSILFKHKTEPLISPKARNVHLSARLSECLERCLAKAPNERFASFDDVLLSLRLPTSATSPWDISDDPGVNCYLEQYRSRREVYLGGRPYDLQEPDVYPFPQQRFVSIEVGNLVEQEVDALVSSDDEALSMGGGVSAALRRAAGPTLEEEAQRYVPVRAGRAVVTPAGALPARFVFHAVTIGRRDREWVLPSRDLISEIMDSCFYHADTLGLQSLAFPLLGTGSGGFPPDVCLDTMFRFLARKFLHGLTTVRLVRIVLFSG
jgi:serine/threonine protein kinase